MSGWSFLITACVVSNPTVIPAAYSQPVINLPAWSQNNAGFGPQWTPAPTPGPDPGLSHELAVGGCKFETADGTRYDFESLRSDTRNLEAQDETYVYKLNPCGIVVNSPVGSCVRDRGAFCQYNKIGSFVSSMAKWELGYPIWYYTNPNDQKQGVTAMFENGDTCYLAGRQTSRKIHMHFECADKDSPYTVHEDRASCDFNVSMRTPLACVHHVGVGNFHAAFLLFIILVPFYCASGCHYNMKRYELKGMEAMPHKVFWEQVFSFASAGLTKLSKKKDEQGEAGSDEPSDFME